jgi:hypothetical protein
MPATRTKKTVTRRPSKAKDPNTPDFEEQLRMRAFEIFQSRMQSHATGDELSDWLEAEKELNHHPVD